MNSTYTITVTSRTDNTVLRSKLLELLQEIETAPKVVEVRLDYDTARGRTPGMEHNPVVRRKVRGRWS